MRSITIICAAAIATSLLSMPAASAGVTTIKSSGGWEAFGGRSSDNRKLCGMSASGGGRWIGVKYFEGEDSLIIQLSKPTWRVKNGNHIDVTMQFDRESPWKAQARAFHMDDGDGAVQFFIGRDQIANWTKEFWQSDTLLVRFPGSEVEDWQADLSGTQEVVEAMVLCLQAINETR